MLSRKTSSFVACLCILAAGSTGCRQADNPASGGVEDKLQPQIHDALDEPITAAAELGDPPATHASGRSLSPFSDVPKTRAGFSLDDDPYGADSAEDQRWLDRNGYPNAEQWRVYSNAEEGLLRLAAESGDQVAQVFLDARLLSQGDTEAVDRLFFAAERGSAFALSMLQAYMVGSSNGNPELGYAIGRVMEMKGDSRIALVRDMAFATPLAGERKMRAEAMALQLFDQLKRNAKHQPFIDPRPSPAQP